MCAKSVAKLLIEARHGDEIRMALLGEEGKLTQYAVERADSKPTRGNIYLAKVSRVEPSLQAAFIDYGGQRNGFLPFSEINPDYYRIPVADRSEENGENHHHYVIQDVISQNRVLLAQINKDERGGKGAALTTYLSLASRYCVLLPNRDRSGGVSKQIDGPAERKRLKGIQDKLTVPEGMSVILRTAALGHSKKEIDDDYKKLAAMWDNVRSLAVSSEGPRLIHEESGILRAAVRDYYSDDTSQILVDGKQACDALLEEMETFMPQAAKKLKLYTGSQPLFVKENIATQVDDLYAPLVVLPSGGSLVINQSEAMISIDVNSGRATRHRHIEDTALATNLEAAKEIARQLRLRDLGGLLVIDFIDMDSRKHVIQVERALWDALRDDRARVQAGRITRFGLLEMTRQRLGLNLQEQVMQKCPHCDGSGWVRSKETGSVELLRKLEEQLGQKKAAKWRLLLSEEQALHFLNAHRRSLAELEKKHETSLEIKPDPSLAGDAFKLQAQDSDDKKAPAAGHSRSRRGARQDSDDKKAPAAALPVRESSTLSSVLRSPVKRAASKSPPKRAAAKGAAAKPAKESTETAAAGSPPRRKKAAAAAPTKDA